MQPGARGKQSYWWTNAYCGPGPELALHLHHLTPSSTAVTFDRSRHCREEIKLSAKSQGMWQSQLGARLCSWAPWASPTPVSTRYRLQLQAHWPVLSPPWTNNSPRAQANKKLEIPPWPGLAGLAHRASLPPWESSWKPCVLSGLRPHCHQLPRAGHRHQGLIGDKGKDQAPLHTLAAPRPPEQCGQQHPGRLKLASNLLGAHVRPFCLSAGLSFSICSVRGCMRRSTKTI